MTKPNRLVIALAVILVIVTSFIVLMHLIGDKPRPESKILYIGPKKISEASDKEYATALAKAKALEKNGNIAGAITQYELASNTNRFVMPSYYPLLDVARLKCEQGDKQQAISILQHFMALADDEVKPTAKSRFTIEDNSNEQIEYVKRLQTQADDLLRKCSAN